MYSISQEMKIRLQETKSLIELSKGMENGTVYSNGIKFNIPVIRSTVILSLYNVVESTITQVLNKIHDEIISQKVRYNNLIKPIKDIALVYFYKHKEKRADIHASLDVLHSTVDMIRGKSHFDIAYKPMSESYQLYSGNLDARIIRKVMKKYGIDISDTYGCKLVNVKNGRNKLAHGEESFEEFGRNVVLKSLEEYFNDVEALLNEVIAKTQAFISNKAYRITSRPRKANKRKKR
ncbi:MAE_28990/MAE_18760 family HEPN-like nuclease [Aeromonas veronii]|uniref:MAE_28990/MAE_18760 family HEPN-like nuclease n=1 Tax=Aeromonas veronii TaxID=654 RepID=UPI003D1D30E1